jgi:hypothetical protein
MDSFKLRVWGFSKSTDIRHAAEEFMHMGCHREAAPLHPVASHSCILSSVPSKTLGPRVDTPYFQPDSSNPFHFVIL